LKTKKILIALIFTLCLMAGLCACKEEVAEEPEFVADDSAYSFSLEANESIEALRNLMKRAEGVEEVSEEDFYCCAIAYLGSVDVSSCAVSVNQLAHDQRLDDSGYGAQYPFLKEISSDKICETEEGSELYAIVPASDAQTVKLRLLTKDENETPVYLYEKNNTDPVVFCVNHDGVHEVQVEITVADGTVYTLVPQILSTTDQVDCGDVALDFTIYPENADEAYLDGAWVCRDWLDDGGNQRIVKLSLDSETHEAQYSLCSDNGQELIHYTGSWFIAPEGYAPYTENDLVLEMESDGGVYMRIGAPSAPFKGAYIVKKNADGSLSVRNTYGDILAYGSEFCDMIFTKESDE